MDPFFITVDEQTIKRERAKARTLRDSAWWKNQLGRGRCYYCHRPMHPAALTMDHKHPVVRGGRSTKTNLVPACKDCNNEKKHMTYSEWISFRDRENRPLACAQNELT